MKCLTWLLAAVATVTTALFFGGRFVIGMLAGGLIFSVGFVTGLLLNKHIKVTEK